MAAIVISLLIILVGSSVIQRNAIRSGSHLCDDSILSASDDNLYSATFVGNIMLGRDVEKVGKAYGYDSLLNDVQDFWKDSDLVFGNLETALLDDEASYKKLRDKEEYFRSSDTAASVLAESGFTALQLANNHTDDYRKSGLRNTIAAVESAGMDVSGAGEDRDEAQAPVVSNGKGVSVSILSVSASVPYRASAGTASAGISTFANGEIYDQIRSAQSTSSTVVVAVHWGEDGSRAVTAEMEEYAHALVDAGADIVLGTGTNSVQPIEIYRDGVILYDLGNFISDDEFSPSRAGALVRFVVSSNSESELRVYPLKLNAFSPSFTKGTPSASRSMKTLVEELDRGSYRIEDGVLVIPLGEVDSDISREDGLPAGETTTDILSSVPDNQQGLVDGATVEDDAAKDYYDEPSSTPVISDTPSSSISNQSVIEEDSNAVMTPEGVENDGV